MDEKKLSAGSSKHLASLCTISALMASLSPNGYYSMDMLADMPKYKYVRHVPQYARKKEQGRNEKCKCHSGKKKYKHCCGK